MFFNIDNTSMQVSVRMTKQDVDIYHAMRKVRIDVDGLHKEAYRYFCIHHDKIRFYMGVLQHHTNFFQKNHKISYKDTLKFVRKFKDFLILGDSGWGLIREYSPISYKINYEIDINE